MKRITLLLIVLSMLLCLFACEKDEVKVGDNVNDNTNDDSTTDSATEEKEIFNKQKYKPDDAREASVNFRKVVEELQATKNNKNEKLDVPVYYEKELFVGSFALAGYFSLVPSSFNSIPNTTGTFLASYPTSAIRINDFGFPYSVHDTETGYRAFTFFADIYGIKPMIMIAIKDILPYSDFLELSVGDPIEKVEEIDPVASLYKQQFIDLRKTISENPLFKDPVLSFAGFHYLKEGLLKIEYGMTEDEKIVITNIEFNKDRIPYVFINCTIDELDLPA